jgi:hypothetical protein
MAMPLEIAAIALPVAGLCVSAHLFGARLYDRLFVSRRSCEWSDTRRCRYCHWGRAHLTAAKAYCEADELVEVQCYTCSRCGLPQWTIMRTELFERVQR